MAFSTSLEIEVNAATLENTTPVPVTGVYRGILPSPKPKHEIRGTLSPVPGLLDYRGYLHMQGSWGM